MKILRLLLAVSIIVMTLVIPFVAPLSASASSYTGLNGYLTIGGITNGITSIGGRTPVVIGGGASTISSMRIVGYFFGSDPDGQINSVEYTKYTHIIYDEIGVTSITDPTLQYYVGSSGGLSSVATKTHAVGGKVLVCLIGGNWAEAGSPAPLTAIMANSGYRSTLASNLATFVTANGLDGVDVDWEGSDVVAANYNSFLSTLRADLGYGKTISVTGAFEWLANMWFSTTVISNYVDFINLMMYDVHPYPEASKLADVEIYTQEWLTAGFSPSKLNLGIPAFGYSAAGGIGDYYHIIASINPANNVNSTTATTTWTTSPAEYWWSGYDLNQSKTVYAISKGLGGMMVYVANEDACGNVKSVIDAVYSSIYNILPSISTSSTSNITNTTATLNGNVTDTGSGNSTVTMYWGTSDGGNVAGNWTNSVAPTSPAQPQGVSAFYYNLTGLRANTTYYFNAYAVNVSGGAWATSQSFTTPTSNTAIVTLSAATAVASTTVVLSGNVTSTGGSNPTVTMYWGTADGDNHVNGWQNHASPLSPPLSSGQPQGVAPFSLGILDLTPGTTYYFNVSATNTAGTSWAGSSLSFTTQSTASPAGTAAITVAEAAGASYTELPLILAVNNSSYLVANGFMRADGLDAVVQSAGGVPLPTMIDSTLTAFVASITQSTNNGFNFTTGNAPVVSMPIIVGDGGYVTTAYDAGLELGGSWEIDISGYINTSSAEIGQYILNKPGEATIEVTAVDQITATVYDGGGSETITLSGISSGVYLMSLTLYSGTLTFTVGTSTNTTSVGTVANNTNNWTWDSDGLVMPYMSYVKETVSGAEIIRYQPNTIVIGTALPNLDSAGLYPGVITFGSNPAGITVTIGPLVLNATQGSRVGPNPNGSGSYAPQSSGSQTNAETPPALNAITFPLEPAVHAVAVMFTASTPMDTAATELMLIRLLAGLTIVGGAIGSLFLIRGHLFIAGIAGTVLMGIWVAWHVYPLAAISIAIIFLIGTVLADRGGSD